MKKESKVYGYVKKGDLPDKEYKKLMDGSFRVSKETVRKYGLKYINAINREKDIMRDISPNQNIRMDAEITRMEQVGKKRFLIECVNNYNDTTFQIILPNPIFENVSVEQEILEHFCGYTGRKEANKRIAVGVPKGSLQISCFNPEVELDVEPRHVCYSKDYTILELMEMILQKQEEVND